MDGWSSSCQDFQFLRSILIAFLLVQQHVQGQHVVTHTQIPTCTTGRKASSIYEGELM